MHHRFQLLAMRFDCLLIFPEACTSSTLFYAMWFQGDPPVGHRGRMLTIQDRGEVLLPPFQLHIIEGEKSIVGLARIATALYTVPKLLSQFVGD